MAGGKRVCVCVCVWGGCCRIRTFKANECCRKTAAIAQVGIPDITISMKVKQRVKFPDTRWNTFGLELRREKKGMIKFKYFLMITAVDSNTLIKTTDMSDYSTDHSQQYTRI